MDKLLTPSNKCIPHNELHTKPLYNGHDPTYLKIENNLSELKSESAKRAARKNLGIEGYAQWGNIQGHIEDQQDLMDIIGNITGGEIQELENQIKEYINPKIDELIESDETINQSISDIQTTHNNFISEDYNVFKEKTVEDIQANTNLVNTTKSELTTNINNVNTKVDNTNTTIQQMAATSVVQLNGKVSKEIASGNSASKQISYTIKNNDFSLNQNYKEAIEKLGNIQSVDDAIAVIMHSLFPVEYINWSFDVSNTATKSYSFEKGATLNINETDSIGTIIIHAVPGNRAELGDEVTEFKVNNSIISGKTGKNEFSHTIAVRASDVLGTQLQFTTSDTKTKDYVCSMKTQKVSDPITETVSATINISTFQNYYYLSSDSIVTATHFNGSSINPSSEDTLNFKSTNKISGVYSLGNAKKYLYLLSPKEVTQVETSAATTSAGAQNGTFSITTAWSQKQVTYSPIAGGTNQNYWLVTLDGQQSNYVKIKVTTK